MAVFVWDINQMGLNDSAVHPDQLGLSSQWYLGVRPKPDSGEYSCAVFLKRDGNIYFIFTYGSIFLKIIMWGEWGRM